MTNRGYGGNRSGDLFVDVYASGALHLLLGEHTYVLSDKPAGRDVFSCSEPLAFGASVK